MKCINGNCDASEIENDDNFCYKCGYWTARGYSFLSNKENINIITSGTSYKQNNKLSIVAFLLLILIVTFIGMFILRGDNLFKPYSYLKKKTFNYIYGYNTSLIKSDNKYNKKVVNTYDEAVDYIRKDYIGQNWLCLNNVEVDMIAYNIENNYDIPSVTFCDIKIDEAKKIQEVIDKLYYLFPNIKGALTNITITNAKESKEYIARFQPMYQFVNINEDINNYSKVNKTQILLNSYYFLNDGIINKPLESVVGDYYVKDATWYSTIAHEMGHYISFLTVLKNNNISSIAFENKDNSVKIKEVLEEFNSGNNSENIIKKALNNYNNKYNTNLTIKEFAGSISKYASSLDKNGNLLADETIAEAIHDYYLHDENMNDASREIINVIKDLL